MNLSQIIGCFILIVVTLILASCGGGGGNGANYTDQTSYDFKLPPVGTTLTYANRFVGYNNYSTNFISSKTISNINEDGSYTSVYNSDATSITELYDATGNFVSQIANNSDPGFLITSSPKAIVFPYPLYVGKTWDSTWINSNARGLNERCDLTDGKVIGTEYITVPAGTFNTLKIQYNSVCTVNPSLYQTLPSPYPSETITSYISDTRTCWLAVDTSIEIQCQSRVSYDSSPQVPVSYPADIMTEQLLSYK